MSIVSIFLFFLGAMMLTAAVVSEVRSAVVVFKGTAAYRNIWPAILYASIGSTLMFIASHF